MKCEEMMKGQGEKETKVGVEEKISKRTEIRRKSIKKRMKGERVLKG